MAQKFLQEQCQIHPKQAAHFDELGTLYQARYAPSDRFC